jgi:hypothetical protein
MYKEVKEAKVVSDQMVVKVVIVDHVLVVMLIVVWVVKDVVVIVVVLVVPVVMVVVFVNAEQMIQIIQENLIVIQAVKKRNLFSVSYFLLFCLFFYLLRI